MTHQALPGLTATIMKRLARAAGIEVVLTSAIGFGGLSHTDLNGSAVRMLDLPPFLLSPTRPSYSNDVSVLIHHDVLSPPHPSSSLPCPMTSRRPTKSLTGSIQSFASS